MDKRMKKRAAFYTLVAILDANKGEILAHNHSIRRVYNDENDIVMAEKTDGSCCLAYDLSFDILDSLVREWRDTHLEKFQSIIQ